MKEKKCVRVRHIPIIFVIFAPDRPRKRFATL